MAIRSYLCRCGQATQDHGAIFSKFLPVRPHTMASIETGRVTHMSDALAKALHANAPSSDRAAQMMLYGQFVGSWEGTLVYRDAEGVRRETSAEVHFGWVLEGRAVQDVWIAPSRRARTATERLLMHGTTLRVYHPGNAIWHITWIDPVRQVFNSMTGRKVGDDIVQEYRNDDGARVQWMFTQIRPDSFHWSARESKDDGETWASRGEFFLRRVAAAS